MSNSVSSRTGRASARRAWLVCLGCGLALFTVMGLGINGFTVYQPYLLERFHLTNGQGSWITTVRSLFSLLSMLSADALCRRLGIRQTMTLGLGFFVVSYALFGAASAFPTLCACAALSGLAYGFGGMIPLTLALSHWFRDRRGLALGLAAGGSGLSTVLAPPLLEEAIQHLGLTAAFWLEGGVGILLTLQAPRGRAAAAGGPVHGVRCALLPVRRHPGWDDFRLPPAQLGAGVERPALERKL